MLTKRHNIYDKEDMFLHQQWLNVKQTTTQDNYMVIINRDGNSDDNSDFDDYNMHKLWLQW